MNNNLKRTLKMKCPNCGYWNRVPVSKIFSERDTTDSKVKVYIPMYTPTQKVLCKKCGNVIAEPKELIRIQKL